MTFLNTVTLVICMVTLGTCVTLARRVPWRTGFLYTMVGLMPLTQIMFIVTERMGWKVVLPSFISDVGELGVSGLFLLAIFIIRMDAVRRTNAEARLRLTEAMLPADADPVEKKLETDLRVNHLRKTLQNLDAPSATK